MSNTITVKGESNIGATLLLILFIALKLTGVIAWSWWWVLAPLWASFALALVIMVAVFLVALKRS